MNELIKRLRQVDPPHGNDDGTRWYRNPDGDEAADRIEALEAEIKRLSIHLGVLDGSACAEEQAMGNGPCGVCTNCLRARIPDPDDLRHLTACRDALHQLVLLHDGPRDVVYREVKEGAWAAAREALTAMPPAKGDG